MRKLILAALVAAAFSIPAFAAQTTPTTAPAKQVAAAAPAPAAAPMKAEHTSAKEGHHAKTHHTSKHHHKAKSTASAAKGK